MAAKSVGKVGWVNALISPAAYSICYTKRSCTFFRAHTRDKEGILAAIRTIRAFLRPGLASLDPKRILRLHIELVDIFGSKSTTFPGG
jgi:hypothetical protein